LALTAGAEQKSLQAIIPWDAEGQLFQVGTDTMLFLGSLEGIIYFETEEGELNEGFVECPLNQKVDMKTQTTLGSGHCMISVSPEETVYAEWTCEGRVGICEGDFNLTAGTGKLEGISGSSRIILRSPLRLLAIDMGSGSELRVKSGLAVLPKLSYEIPAKP
jgi:hypothetical protein